MRIFFEWDEKKADKNYKKHHVSFETAVQVFSDPFLLSCQDRIEEGEYRWQTIGLVDGSLVLLVAHVTWDNEDGSETIRIISARRADKKERKRYEQNRSL